MGGRPRKPEALKIADGDYVVHPERRPKNPSMPAVKSPVCPDWIQGIAREEWQRICSELKVLKVVALAERGSLEQYCTAYAEWRSACATLAEEPRYYATKTGYAEHPAGKAQRALALICHKMLCEFGMTPVSRTRLVITEGTDADEQAKRFFG